VLPTIGGNAGTMEAQNGAAFIVSWRLRRGGELVIAANLSAEAACLPAQNRGTLIFAHGDGAADALADGTLPPWSVICRLDRGREGSP
jgi:maltooligosyltrehalose trehalohydrolase